MNEVFKSVGLVARFDKKEAIELSAELARHLRRKGLQVFVEDTLGERMPNKENVIPLERMTTDFIITIGGDGTILRACAKIPKAETPILSINMGLRGFLAEAEPKEAFIAVDKCLKNDFRIEKCSKLSVSTADEILPDALNDVVISGGEPSKILYMRVFKDGAPILKCQADGLIVSTQTGSTGYSLSAGGPVLDPGIEAFVLTPICSLTVFRSLVVPSDTEITIETIRPEKILVLVDGNCHRLMTSAKPTLKVTRSQKTAAFIRFKDDFYRRLRSRVLFRGMG